MNSGSINRPACTRRASALRSEAGRVEVSTSIGVGENLSSEARSSGRPGTGAAVEIETRARTARTRAARMGRPAYTARGPPSALTPRVAQMRQHRLGGPPPRSERTVDARVVAMVPAHGDAAGRPDLPLRRLEGRGGLGGERVVDDVCAEEPPALHCGPEPTRELRPHLNLQLGDSLVSTED